MAGSGSSGARGDNPLVWTKFVAETLLPTKQGKFRVRGYRHTTDGGRTFTEPSVIIAGTVEGCADVPVRVHDACFTSEVLGSLKCDCREQLQLALDFIQHNPPGMVIYLQQEGRGIGLANKIAAYALQEKGLDTVDANRALGLPDDCREYSAVQHILNDLGITSIRLMTNNPRKMSEMAQRDIAITGRIPCLVKAQAYNASYLSAKERRMAHLLSYDAEDWGSANGGGPVGPSGAQAAGAAGDADALAELSSADEASFEERAAGLVGGAEAVVSEGVVGLVVGHGGGHRVPLAAAPEAAECGQVQQQQQQQQPPGLEPEAVDESQLDGSFCYWDHEGEPSSAGIPLQPQVPLPEGLDSIPGPAPSSSGSSTSSSSANSRRPGSTGGCGGSSSTSMDC